MSKATILTVDDDPMVLRAITRDLRARYGSDFRIVKASSGAQALSVLTELALRLRPVALIATDQRMPDMTGTDMLRQARQHAPDAKLLLLTAYADTDVAIKAINDIGLDYYLLKPWDPPAERLYPVIDDLLGDWQRAHPQETGDVRVVDHRWSERGHEITTFLTRNYVPYRWVDVDQDDGQRLQDLADAPDDDLPLVFVPDREVLRSPSTRDLAGALGLRTRALQPLYDLCIVGGGPAGLAAAVYAASEGLRTVVVEREAPGGQAGQSASIENYLGFPRGLSGADLTHRAVAQVSRFGAEMLLPLEVVSFQKRGPVRAVCFGAAGEIEARALLVATGVSYRRLEAPGLAELTGRGDLLRRVRRRCRPVRRRRRGRRRCSQLGRSGGPQLRQVRPARAPARARRLARGQHVALPRGAGPGRCQHRRPAAQRGRGGPRRRPPGVRHCSPTGTPGTRRRSPSTGCSSSSAPHRAPHWLGSDVVRDDKGFVVTGQDLLASSPTAWSEGRSPFTWRPASPASSPRATCGWAP